MNMEQRTAVVKVLIEHVPTPATGSSNKPWSETRFCSCGHQATVLHDELTDDERVETKMNQRLALHIADKLAEAL